MKRKINRAEMAQVKMGTRKIKTMTINGKPVVDGVAKKVLHIIAADVLKADVHNPETCAAAIACMRQFRVPRARVTLGRTYLEYPSVWVRYMTPPQLRAEIISFDRGYKGWKGGDFSLYPVPPAQRAGVKRVKATAPKGLKKSKPRHRPKGVRAAFHASEFKEE